MLNRQMYELEILVALALFFFFSYKNIVDLLISYMIHKGNDREDEFPIEKNPPAINSLTTCHPHYEEDRRHQSMFMTKAACGGKS